MGETSHLSKRVKSSSSSLDSTKYIQASTALRSHPAQAVHLHVSKHPPKSSQTKSCISQGIKRKVADGEDVGCRQRNSDHYKSSDGDRKRYAMLCRSTHLQQQLDPESSLTMC